jgi:hypothetical protein
VATLEVVLECAWTGDPLGRVVFVPDACLVVAAVQVVSVVVVWTVQVSLFACSVAAQVAEEAVSHRLKTLLPLFLVVAAVETRPLRAPNKACQEAAHRTD